MNIKFKLLSFIYLISSFLNAQFISINNGDGLMITNGIGNLNNKFYFYGSIQGKVNILDTVISNENTSSFLVIKENDNYKILTPFLSTTSYSEINEYYSVDSSVFLSGIYTKNSTSISSFNKNWGNFFLKIGNNDSINWIRYLRNIGKSTHLKVTNYKNNLFLSYITIDSNKSSNLNILCLDEFNGDSIWTKSINIKNDLMLENIFFQSDTISIYLSSKSSNWIFKFNNQNQALISEIENSKSKKYIIFNKFYKNKLNTINVLKEKNSYNLFLSSFDTLNTDLYLGVSDYFAAASILNENDSLISIIVHYNGGFLIDSTYYLESDSSNCTLIIIQKGLNKIIYHSNIPIRNVFYVAIKDSSFYFGSNYIDGSSFKNSSTLIGSNPIQNSDTRISTIENLKCSYKIKTKVINENFSYTIFPNFSNGSKINIIINEGLNIDFQEISLWNNLGQIMTFEIVKNDNIISLINIKCAQSGFYYLRFSNSYGTFIEKIAIISE